jgi:hypothetical protein
MSLESEIETADGSCPCWEPAWAAVQCRNCAAHRKHYVDDCEWRGHAAIRRLVTQTRLDTWERIKPVVDRDPALSAQVKTVVQGA